MFLCRWRWLVVVGWTGHSRILSVFLNTTLGQGAPVIAWQRARLLNSLTFRVVVTLFVLPSLAKAGSVQQSDCPRLASKADSTRRR